MDSQAALGLRLGSGAAVAAAVAALSSLAMAAALSSLVGAAAALLLQAAAVALMHPTGAAALAVLPWAEEEKLSAAQVAVRVISLFRKAAR